MSVDLRRKVTRYLHRILARRNAQEISACRRPVLTRRVNRRYKLASKLDQISVQINNHGFIFHQGGWRLSTAYDINPVTPADGLHLFITDDDNRLDYTLAMDVIDLFRLKPSQAKNIQDEVLAAVGNWRNEAATVKLSRHEQNKMAGAFNV